MLSERYYNRIDCALVLYYIATVVPRKYNCSSHKRDDCGHGYVEDVYITLLGQVGPSTGPWGGEVAMLR